MRIKSRKRWLLLPVIGLMIASLTLVGCSSDDTSLVALDIDGIEATVDNAISGDYPIVRPLNYVTNGEPTGVVKDFIDYCLSEAGQEIAVEEGYISVATGAAMTKTGLTGNISIAGSTTVQPLSEAWRDAFNVANPGVTITIQGGGSSVGVTSCGTGTADIGAASREIKDSELDTYTDMKIHVLCRDGIAIVANIDDSVTGLTVEEVRDIFSGVTTNWSDVGGPDKEIHVIAREEGSGTRGAFEELVMEDESITEDADLFSSNGSLKTAVDTTPYSIGFLSFGYL